jgi:hypothetical protein
MLLWHLRHLWVLMHLSGLMHLWHQKDLMDL